jgi:hypothetical protein
MVSVAWNEKEKVMISMLTRSNEVNAGMVLILMGIILLSLLYSAYILVRNPYVHRFVMARNAFVYAWCIRHLYEIGRGEEESAYDWFPMEDPSYAKLLHSFKPLRMEAWYSEELLTKLLN